MKRGARNVIFAVLSLAVIIVALFTIGPKTTTKITYLLPPPIFSKARPPSEKPILLTMEADGRLAIDGAPTTLETLVDDLTKRFKGVPKDKQRVMIRATSEVSYQQFMPVLTRLQEHGWTKVGLINEELTTPKP